MNKKQISIGLMLAAIVAIAKPAQSELPVNIGMAKSKIEAKDIEVKNFTGIAAGGPLKVIVTLGNTEGIEFEGDEGAISTLIAEVKGNALIIRPEMSWTSWSTTRAASVRPRAGC